MNTYIFHPKAGFYRIKISGLTIQVPSITLKAENLQIAKQAFELLMLDMPDIPPLAHYHSITSSVAVVPQPEKGTLARSGTLYPNPRKQRNPTNPPSNQSI